MFMHLTTAFLDNYCIEEFVNFVLCDLVDVIMGHNNL